MGTFSYTCAKTNLPIIVTNEMDVDGKSLNKVMFFAGPGSAPVKGRLSEYGDLHTRRGVIDVSYDEIGDDLEAGRAKFVLADFMGEKDTYETIGRSHIDPGQGGLMYDDRFIVKAVRAGGFYTIDGLNMAHYDEVPIKIATCIKPSAILRLNHAKESFGSTFSREYLSRIPELTDTDFISEVKKLEQPMLSHLIKNAEKYVLLMVMSKI